MRLETGAPAVAVDLFEQRRISHTSRIEIDVWRKGLLADGIFHQEHIFDVRIVEHRIERLGAFAVVDAHARAVLPNKVVAFDPIDEIRICLDKRRWGIGGPTLPTLSETCSHNGEHDCEQQSWRDSDDCFRALSSLHRRPSGALLLLPHDLDEPLE